MTIEYGIARALLFALVYLFMITCHEFGHIVIMRIYLKEKVNFTIKLKRKFPPKIEMVAGTSQQYNRLSDDQYNLAVGIGILVGYLVMIPFGVYIFSVIELLLITGLYTWGSWNDIMIIKKAGWFKDETT